VVIATKFGGPELIGLDPDGNYLMSGEMERQGTSRRWITTAIEESLRRLKRDHIDLYQVHVPPTDDGELMETLDGLVRSGKVRAIGYAPTYATPEDLGRLNAAAEAGGWAPFAAMQTQYNMLCRSPEQAFFPYLRQHGMGLLPYFPLANGLLTGKYRKGAPYPAKSRLDNLPLARDLMAPEGWDKLEPIHAFAADRDMSMAELAIAWLLKEPLVASVIAGATRPEQVRENSRASARRLSDADFQSLRQIL
jgi:aryl-alcohol dehydrogenase-like predicted oxidoreductase